MLYYRVFPESTDSYEITSIGAKPIENKEEALMAHGDYRREIQRLEEQQRQRMRERVVRALIIVGVSVVGISVIATILIFWRSGQLFH